MIYGYARVSTAEQNIEPQVEQLKSAGCQRVFQEKASGADRERPELARLLSYACKGDTIIICKLDRIARSTQHLLSLVEKMDAKGVIFKVLNAQIDTSTPTGKLILTMLGAIATFEREIMLERQREGIIAAQREGKYTGRAPTARSQAGAVLSGLSSGLTAAQVAAACGIGIASVYRIQRDYRDAV